MRRISMSKKHRMKVFLRKQAARIRDGLSENTEQPQKEEEQVQAAVEVEPEVVTVTDEGLSVEKETEVVLVEKVSKVTKTKKSRKHHQIDPLEEE